MRRKSRHSGASLIGGASLVSALTSGRVPPDGSLSRSSLVSAQFDRFVAPSELGAVTGTEWPGGSGLSSLGGGALSVSGALTTLGGALSELWGPSTLASGGWRSGRGGGLGAESWSVDRGVFVDRSRQRLRRRQARRYGRAVVLSADLAARCGAGSDELAASDAGPGPPSAPRASVGGSVGSVVGVVASGPASLADHESRIGSLALSQLTGADPVGGLGPAAAQAAGLAVLGLGSGGSSDRIHSGASGFPSGFDDGVEGLTWVDRAVARGAASSRTHLSDRARARLWQRLAYYVRTFRAIPPQHFAVERARREAALRARGERAGLSGAGLAALLEAHTLEAGRIARKQRVLTGARDLLLTIARRIAQPDVAASTATATSSADESDTTDGDSNASTLSVSGGGLAGESVPTPGAGTVLGVLAGVLLGAARKLPPCGVVAGVDGRLDLAGDGAGAGEDDGRAVLGGSYSLAELSSTLELLASGVHLAMVCLPVAPGAMVSATFSAVGRALCTAGRVFARDEYMLGEVFFATAHLLRGQPAAVLSGCAAQALVREILLAGTQRPGLSAQLHRRAKTATLLLVRTLDAAGLAALHPAIHEHLATALQHTATAGHSAAPGHVSGANEAAAYLLAALRPVLGRIPAQTAWPTVLVLRAFLDSPAARLSAGRVLGRSSNPRALRISLRHAAMGVIASVIRGWCAQAATTRSESGPDPGCPDPAEAAIEPEPQRAAKMDCEALLSLAESLCRLLRSRAPSGAPRQLTRPEWSRNGSRCWVRRLRPWAGWFGRLPPRRPQHAPQLLSARSFRQWGTTSFPAWLWGPVALHSAIPHDPQHFGLLVLLWPRESRLLAPFRTAMAGFSCSARHRRRCCSGWARPDSTLRRFSGRRPSMLSLRFVERSLHRTLVPILDLLIWMRVAFQNRFRPWFNPCSARLQPKYRLRPERRLRVQAGPAAAVLVGGA